jgi:hypothetical protein
VRKIQRTMYWQSFQANLIQCSTNGSRWRA